MKSLNDEQITKLTKGIIKFCIMPELVNSFEYPSFSNFHKACEGLENCEDILENWLNELDTNIDAQIAKIYQDIFDSIKDHLNNWPI